MRKIFILQLFFSMLISSYAQHGKQYGVAWKYTTNGPIRSGILAENDRIYFGNSAGQFLCLDANGKKIWERAMKGAIVAAPAASSSIVVVVSRDRAVYALDKQDGSILWSFDMATPQRRPIGGWKYFGASPVIWEDHVYVGSGDGALYALSLVEGTLTWKYETEQSIRAAPVLDGTQIYLPSNDGHIHVLDMEGQLLWQFETDATKLDNGNLGLIKRGIYNQPTLADNLLVFGSRDGNTYAVDVKTQQEKWRFSFGSTWAMSNSVDEAVVFVGWSTNNKVSAHDLASGQKLWDRTLGAHNYTKALPLESTVVFGSADGNIYGLDKNNGEERWSVEIGAEIYSSPSHAEDLIIFGADDGALYAIKELVPPMKVVYLPEEIRGNAQYLVVDKKVAPYLVEKGFAQLDSLQLLRFIEARIADQTPSVIVFALPLVPSQIIGQDPADGLLRKYLDHGGKILWFGDVPNYYELDQNDQFKRDPQPGSTLLGVNFQNVNESGNYYSRATQDGLNWGLPDWFKSTAAIIAPQEGVVPLAFDEFGRISVWVKPFDERPGSGFVSCRTWGWNLPIKPADLEIINLLATYGLE